MGSRTDFIPRGNVVLFRGGSFVRSWSGSTDALRGTALRNAVAAMTASTFDRLLIGGGAFDIGNNYLPIPATSSVDGAGIDVTTILSSYNVTTHAVFVWPANGFLSGFTVNASGADCYPCGTGDTDASPNGCAAMNVRAIGLKDGFFWAVGNAAHNLWLHGCRGENTGAWDAFANFCASTVNCFDCRASVSGAGATIASAFRGGLLSGILNIYGGRADVTGGSVTNCALRADEATVNAYGLVCNVSGTNPLEAYPADVGTINTSGVTRVGGGLLRVSGSGHTRIDEGPSRGNAILGAQVFG